jgi:hypothetical protein
MAKVYDANKKIWILVDLENITMAEMTRTDRLSYSKLKEYARQFGKVFQAEIYAPHHYLDSNRGREVNYFNRYGWKVVICGRVKKDKDLVDYRLSSQASDIAFHYPEDEVWIISRDSDFTAIVEKNKDRGKHNIRLIDPFTIPEILGYEDREIESVLSRQVVSIIESMKVLTPIILGTETDEQRLIRYSAGWFLNHKSQVMEFNNHNMCVSKLSEFLNKRINKRLRSSMNFPKYAITAYKESGMICEVENGKRSYQLLINRDHETFSRVAPPHFVEQVIAR